MKVFSYQKLAELLADPRVKVSGVAQVAGISSTALHYIKTGKKKPGINTISAIAAALNKPIDYFMVEAPVNHQQKLPLKTERVANG